MTTAAQMVDLDRDGRRGQDSRRLLEVGGPPSVLIVASFSHPKMNGTQAMATTPAVKR